VRHKIDCPREHEIEVYCLEKWPRAFHLDCKQCSREVFVKSFGQDPGVGLEERERRYDIERNNLEDLARKDLCQGSFSNGSFNIPHLIGSLGFPHFALIQEYIGSEVLSAAISTAIHSRNSDDLRNALSVLAKFLVTLHERTTIELPPDSIPSLNDTQPILNMLADVGEYDDLLTQLYLLHSKWLQDDFFKSSLTGCLAHGGLTPVNLLYSPANHRITITDLETLRYDTSFVDIGTVCAELKLSFVIDANNSYLAEPYIAYFLREYFAHLKKPELTYRQFTWVQAYFMGRRMLVISQGAWLDSSLRRWCVDQVKSMWGLIDHEKVFTSPPFLGIKAVFFDFYNTLVSVEDDEGDLKNFETVRNYAMAKWPSVGTEFASAEELKETYFSVIQGMSEGSKEEYPDVDLEVVWAQTFERLKIGPPTILIYDQNRRRMREVLKVFRQSALKRFEVFEGAIEVIKMLKNHNYRTGIISDAQMAYVESELERLEILPFIDCFLVSAPFRFRKPDRRFFEWALRKVQVQPEDAVFVGDDMFRDIFGAKQIGMRTIYKPSEYGQSFYESCVPDEVVTDFRKLPELFGISMKSE
jgi:putative hydrolase of the HAD superfamily